MDIDISAIAAILLREPDRARYAEAIDHTPTRLMSAVTRVELACVIEGKNKAMWDARCWPTFWI